MEEILHLVPNKIRSNISLLLLLIPAIVFVLSLAFFLVILK